MKRIYGVLLLMLVFMQACSKDPPGEISVDLSVSTIPQNVRNSIDQFVFIIGESGSSRKLLYPSACLGCSSNASPCPVAAQCLKSTDCGFSADPATFDPQIDFEDVEEGATMQIIACGLDNSSSPVAGGDGEIENTAGESASVTMTTDTTTCVNNLPSTICP